ncbi:hypothetical protein KKE03_01530 [Patescibacteria group bacterium]|nr:hypothetical protein [Patescibacteria group bacterium]
MKEKQKIIVAVLGVLFIVASIPVAIFLVNQRQEIRKEAAKPESEGGIVKISLTPSESFFTTTNPLEVSLNLNTEGRVISGIAIRLYYNYSGEEPTVRPVLDGSRPFTVSPTIGFGCQVNTFTYEENVAEINLGCAIMDTAGYSNSVDTQLATLTFSASSAPADPVAINFHPTISNVLDKATNQDILLLPDAINGTLLGTYTVSDEGVAPTNTPTLTPIPAEPTNTPTLTPTPVPGSGGVDTPTNTPTLTPTLTPTPVPGSGGASASTNTPTLTVDVGGQDVPVSGVIENTIVFIAIGSLFLLLGFALIL